MWVPTGEDNTGVNDRHWIANRRDAEGVFRRWDALVSNSSIYHLTFFATTKVRPAFMSSETFNTPHACMHATHTGAPRLHVLRDV